MTPVEGIHIWNRYMLQIQQLVHVQNISDKCMTIWQHIPPADFTSQHAYGLQESARVTCIIAVRVIFSFRLLYMLVLSSACKLHKHGCSSAQQSVSQHFACSLNICINICQVSRPMLQVFAVGMHWP